MRGPTVYGISNKKKKKDMKGKGELKWEKKKKRRKGFTRIRKHNLTVCKYTSLDNCAHQFTDSKERKKGRGGG